MRSGYASEEDWVWYEKLPKDIQDRITRLFSVNDNFKAAYKRGYQKGYKAADNKFRKLVIIREHGEDYGT